MLPLGHAWEAAALMGKHVVAEEDGGGASAGRRMAGAGSWQGGPEGNEHDLCEINSVTDALEFLSCTDTKLIRYRSDMDVLLYPFNLITK